MIKGEQIQQERTNKQLQHNNRPVQAKIQQKNLRGMKTNKFKTKRKKIRLKSNLQKTEI